MLKHAVRKVFVVCFVFTLTMHASWAQTLTPRFICNSLDAVGNVSSDKCGACTILSAPRWVPASVEVLIGSENLPSGVSSADWMNVALQGLDAWSNAPGTSLKLQHKGKTIKRTFGEDKDVHEIFWISDKTEWMTKVGTGSQDTLAATLSPYYCPTLEREMREIFDADLAMNSVNDQFAWRARCAPGGNCNSVFSTLTHEVGHFIGMGHPCEHCGQSIMTAKAGFNVEKLMPVDMLGVNQLYPGESSGELASICESNADCKENICTEQNGANYCSRSCVGNECPNGFTCDSGVCQFESGRLVGPGDLGDKCSSLARCIETLQCAGINQNETFCLKPCKPAKNNADCGGQYQCNPFKTDETKGVCIKVVGLGEVCSEADYCLKERHCVFEKEKNESRCRNPCDLAKKEEQCAEGKECKDVGDGLMACLDKAPSPPKPPADAGTGKKADFCSCVQVEQNNSRTIFLGFLGVFLLSALFLKRNAS